MAATAKKHGRRYPWAKWFKRSRFVLTRGHEFDSQLHGMAQTIRNTAASPKWRLSVAIRIEEDEGRIIVDVLGPSSTSLKKGAANGKVRR